MNHSTHLGSIWQYHELCIPLHSAILCDIGSHVPNSDFPPKPRSMYHVTKITDGHFHMLAIMLNLYLDWPIAPVLRQPLAHHLPGKSIPEKYCHWYDSARFVCLIGMSQVTYWWGKMGRNGGKSSHARVYTTTRRQVIRPSLRLLVIVPLTSSVT